MAIKVQSANNTIRVGVSTGGSTGSIQATYDPTEYYSNLARDWAIKMDGKVQEQDYSSKYYAQDSKNSAMLAMDIVTDFDDHVQQIENDFDTNAQNKIDEATIWAEGTDEQVQALGGEHSAKGWAELGGFDIEDATTDIKGIIQIATEQEADEGLNTTKAMTPALVSKEISDNVGRGIVLGFDGILENNVLTFAPADGIAYDLKNNYDYEIDLHFPAVGLLPDDTDVKIINGMDEIAIRNVLSGSLNATYGDLRQVCDYIEDIGWRWIFTARYKSVNSDRAFVMQATTVALQQTLDNASEHTVPSTKSIIDSLEIKADKNNVLNKSQISNCILETPHMVDLTLIDGTITLKAGSKLIFPWGKEAPTYSIGDSLAGGVIEDISWDGDKLFYIVKTISDASDYYETNGDKVYLYSNLATSINGQDYTKTSTVSSDPVGNGLMWYNESENIIKRRSNSGELIEYMYLPVAVASRGGSGYTNINQTFQHLGYIGSTIWAMSGIKGLIPNGRNEDGSLNNTEYTTNNVIIYNIPANRSRFDKLALNSSSFYLMNDSWFYDIQDNRLYSNEDFSILNKHSIVAAVSSNNGAIASFNPKAQFQVLDYNSMTSGEISTIVEAYIRGASGYHIYSNGYCEQWGCYSASGLIPAGVVVNLIKPFINTDYQILTSGSYGVENQTTTHLTVIQTSALTKDSFKLHQRQTVSSDYFKKLFWCAKGYIE